MLVALVVVLLVGPSFLILGSSAHGEDALSKTSLTFVPLKPVVPCGDGSPAGVYESRATNSNNHVLVVEGGGFCDTDESCQDFLRTRFYRFSSTVLPEEIEGSQILSDNERHNPTMFNYNKWLVPYCSQDLFLGAGTGRVGGLVRAGSLHLLAVIEQIRNSTQQIDQLVVVGLSAGAMGVANHMNQFREMAQELGVQNLKIILDSSMFYDKSDRRNLDVVSSLYIDHSVHPLCNIKDYPISSDVGTLPCCGSIHCHIRNGLFESAITTINNSTATSLKESFLLFDSSYDPMMAMEVVSEAFDGSDNDDGTKSAESQLLFEMVEVAGSRLHSVSDTLLNSPATMNNGNATNVIWAVSSCLTHPFLTSSSLEPSFHKIKVENPREFTEYSGDDAFAVTVGIILDDDSSTKIGISNSAHKWEDATVGERSIKNLIGFVSPHLDFPNTGIMVLTDNCSGPNCVPAGATYTNKCQEYVVVKNDLNGVPFGLQVFLAGFIGLFIISFFLRFCYPDKRDTKWTLPGSQTDADSVISTTSMFKAEMMEHAAGIKINNLSVFSQSEQPILSDVNIELRPGTVNGLLGRSGSGKSTLLGACCGQMRPGTVIGELSDIKVNLDATTYLRQHDNVSLENLTPSSYLRSSAEIYGSGHEVLEEICDFVKPFFPKRVSEDDDEGEGEDLSAEPFETTRIKTCSGGQRRVLAVAAALLTRPMILLLDEPLSGLDSVASERLMSLLKSIATRQELTILLTVHQPSDDILGYLDELIILKEGRKVFNEAVPVMVQALEMEGGRRMSDCIHEGVKKGLVREFSEGTLGCTQDKGGCESASTVLQPNDSRSTAIRQRPHALSQVVALSRRLHLEYGSNWTDLYLLPVCYVITALVLSMREKSPFQISMSIMFFIYLPVLIYQHHNPLALQMWNAHRMELDDRRISCASYYISTLTFTMPIPLLSILISYPMAFAIMGWEFTPFLVVFLFAAFYLLLMIETGRCLMLLFRGNHIYWKIFLLILFFNIIFAGILASPASASDGVVWIFAINFTHWVLAGSVLTMYETLDSLTEGTCQSFLTCLLSDGAFVAGLSGFGHLATPLKAMVVVVGILVFLGISEYLLLRSRRTHFVDSSSVVSSPNSVTVDATSTSSAASDGETDDCSELSGYKSNVPVEA